MESHSVQYFLNRFTIVLPNVNVDQLEEQFLNHQLLATDEIPNEVNEWLDYKKVIFIILMIRVKRNEGTLGF